jgi:hypothetical protein
MLPPLEIKNQANVRGVLTKRFADWTATNVTLSSYTSTDRTSIDATTLTGSTQFANLASALVMKPGRQYALAIRAKVNDTYRWSISANYIGAGGGVQTDTIYLPKAPVDTGNWFKAVVPISSDPRERRLQIMLNDAPGTTSTLTVDYVNLIELAFAGTVSRV